MGHSGGVVSYFSQVQIDEVKSTETIKRLLAQENRNYQLHQLLWELFPDHQNRPFLFREYMNSNRKRCFYVLSSEEPSPEHPQLRVQSKPFAPQLSKGQVLAFDLRANPIVSQQDPRTGKPKRHDVMMAAKHHARQTDPSVQGEALHQIMTQAATDWLCDPKRLANWGVTITAPVQVSAYQQHHLQRPKNRTASKTTQQTIQFSSVDYQGLLTVDEPDRFLTQLLIGFGRSKAFGCGLMLIRPS